MSNTAVNIAAAALPNFVTEVEIRSALTPPVRINIRDALAPQPPGTALTFNQKLTALLRPTIIFHGGPLDGTGTSPYGVVPADEWKRNLTVLGLGGILLLTGAYFSGWRHGRRSAR